ncbi:hypothetical protein BGZ60DRAFT_430505 [Tricladium varicosporioides]|nr:hypothetical protein BGZ60DRAFT_430505 [Hymenoscyphus varicosporioides]
MFGLAIQPPARVRPGEALYPPPAARLSTVSNNFGQLSQIWAVATLIKRDSGETLYNQLGGRLADSAHPLPEGMHSSGSSTSKDRAYFYFPDLVINEPGRYRIRISLMEMDYSCGGSSSHGAVKVAEYVDSHSIIVEEGATSRARPNAQERAFMRVLRDDGQYIPSSSS